MLDHDPGVGGRFSVLTNVGLLPAAVLGLDIARDPRRAPRRRSRRCWRRSTPPMCRPRSAPRSTLRSPQHGKPISVLMAYADRLERFTRWYVQLWAESLGKDGKGTTPLGALGPVDQHSQLQLFIAGPRDKLFTVITVGSAGPRPAHRCRTCQARRRAGSRRQDHRRSRRRARPRHRRDAGEERLPGAHDPSVESSTRQPRRTADAFHAGDDHRRASASASTPSTSRRWKRARCWRRSIWTGDAAVIAGLDPAIPLGRKPRAGSPGQARP